ncbi:hypothetical protein F899_02117 [Acinetobacter sp. CIP 101934]|uniref:Uncharacterized protein n=1 Tax=Acinetobacter schindleri CIP 107287 TaxID=1217988 RepID=N9AKY0_9GAMM|nr:hypothetical protein F955_01490 [Acinetobacter schindleri CIP 107287]ENX00819.1 hypothetical protein F899_02117 [Acinetobacter sp. CIP 101934]
MTYLTALVLSLFIFALIVVWSLIEIYLDMRKEENLEHEA